MKIKYLIIIIIILLSVTANVYGDYYPLVVYGGEPEGIMAAISAARKGIDTLLIMERKNPGGLMTYGKLNYLDLSYGPEGNILANDLFTEWHEKVGGNVTFSVDRATNIFNKMLKNEKNITIYRNCRLLEVTVKDNSIINELIVDYNNIAKKVKCSRVIDASQDADLTVRAGAPYFYGGADIGLPERTMAATLILNLGNINVSRLKLDVNNNKYGPSYISNDHAWGFIKLGKMYKQHNPNIRLRGLNIVLKGSSLNNNDVFINGMLIFNVHINKNNDYKLMSPEEAYIIGKKEAKFVTQYLKENLKGFESAVLLEFPGELYIRESRHVITHYQLKTSDLIAGKIFEDSIALASYPLDYQASNPDYAGFVLFNPDKYGIPFRSLIPLNLKNLLVTGRSAGYSSLAAASARVLPTGMSTGEAAGTAASISIKNKILFNRMFKQKKYIKLLQEDLKIDNNTDESISNIIDDNELLPYLNELISWGLVIGGYNNNFRLNDIINEKFFSNLLIKGLKRREAEIFYEWVPGGLTTVSKDQKLTRDRAAMLLLVATSQRISEIDKDMYYKKALSLNLIPDIIYNSVKNNRSLTRREAFIIAGSFLKKYRVSEEIRFFRRED